MSLNTITLAGLPVYDGEEGVAGLNRFVMRTGASRFGRGAVLMHRADYDTMSQKIQNGDGQNAALVPLNMTGDPGPGVTFNVLVGGAEPASTSVTESTADDFVRVTIYDTRASYFNPLQKAYNVVMDGFTLLPAVPPSPPDPGTPAMPRCYPDTINGSKPWTWNDLLTDAEIISASPPSAPTWIPNNLIWDNVPKSRVIDDIAAQLFYVVGFDYQQFHALSAFLLPPGTALPGNADLFQQATQAGAIIGGGPAARESTRLPAKLVVTFPGVGAADVYSQRSYTKTIASGFGNSSDPFSKIALHVGSQIAIWSGSSFGNQTALDAVATDMANRAAAFVSQPFLQYELAGIWPFKPDGVYRQVEWICDRNGARTILRSDNARDWNPTDPLNDPINLVSNQEVVGLGSMMVGIGQNGTKYVFPPQNRAILQITGNCNCGAMYTAMIVSPAPVLPNNTLSIGLNPSDVYESHDPQVYVINFRELTGTDTHMLNLGSPVLTFEGEYWGNDPVDKTPIYRIDACN